MRLEKETWAKAETRRNTGDEISRFQERDLHNLVSKILDRQRKRRGQKTKKTRQIKSENMLVEIPLGFTNLSKFGKNEPKI